MRLAVVVGVLYCAPALLALPAREALRKAAGKSESVRGVPASTSERRARSPYYQTTSHFKVWDLGSGMFGDYQEGPGGGFPSSEFPSGDFYPSSDFSPSDNEISPQILAQFTPPDPATKEARLWKFYGNTIFEEPPHAYALVHDEPFFETFNHAKAIMYLEKRRKKARLPPHLLKSLRPYFPFSSEKIILLSA